MGRATVIDGAAVAAALRRRVAEVAARLRGEIGTAPGLATVLVGDDPASQVYVRAKGRACAGSELAAFDIRLPSDISEAELAAEIEKLNRRRPHRRGPRSAAAAAADRSASDRGYDRPGQGCGRVPPGQCRAVVERASDDGALHAARLSALAAHGAPRPDRARRCRSRPLEHRRKTAGGVADRGRLHGHGDPLQDP